MIKRVTVIGLIVCILFSGTLVAETGEVKLLVRTLLASKPVSEEQLNKKHKVKLGKDIKDLRSKLERLPYRKFQMLASKMVSVPPKKKVPLRMDSGGSINFRLLYANAERAGIWLNWLDASGMELLNTRMHFSCHESMLAGTESAEEQATLLAVSLQP